MAKSLSTSSYQDIMNGLRNKVYSPLYFLMGDEPYYLDKITDYIQKNILNETEADFNLTVMYGKDVDIDIVINAAKRYPMMSEYQVVLVKEAQDIKNWDDLSFYLQNPLKSTILCFSYKYGKPDGRKKWFVDVSKRGIIFESKKIYENQVGGWINDYLGAKKIRISQKAEVMLTEFLGNDLSKIANELDKLLLTKPAESTEITPDLIEKNIGISKDYNVFELQDALINKDVLKANRIIQYFGDNKKANPIQWVLIQLFSFFSNLMIYHYLADKRNSSLVASALKINPYFVSGYVKAASNFNARKTMNIISDIRETDARSKGINNIGADDLDLMKELVFKILH